MTNQTEVVPTSSPARPNAGDDHGRAGRLGRPPLTWTTCTAESNNPTPNTASSSHQTGTTSHPTGRILNGPRSTPAWAAALTLLGDEKWHTLHDLHQVMLNASDLAPRTIANQIRSPSARGWIQRSGGLVRLRHRDRVEAALDLSEARP